MHIRPGVPTHSSCSIAEETTHKQQPHTIHKPALPLWQPSGSPVRSSPSVAAGPYRCARPELRAARFGTHSRKILGGRDSCRGSSRKRPSTWWGCRLSCRLLRELVLPADWRLWGGCGSATKAQREHEHQIESLCPVCMRRTRLDIFGCRRPTFNVRNEKAIATLSFMLRAMRLGCRSTAQREVSHRCQRSEHRGLCCVPSSLFGRAGLRLLLQLPSGDELFVVTSIERIAHRCTRRLGKGGSCDWKKTPW